MLDILFGNVASGAESSYTSAYNFLALTVEFPKEKISLAKIISCGNLGKQGYVGAMRVEEK